MVAMIDETLLREFIKRSLLERSAPPARARRPGISKTGKWTAWPSATLKIPYAAPSTGIGPGEERLAWMMNGKVMGLSVSYDIEAADGTTWEVKEPVRGKFRAGTESLAASTAMRQSIENVAKMIVNAFKTAKKTVNVREFMPQEDLKTIALFIDADVPMIMKGEIPQERMERMLNVLMIINSMLSSESSTATNPDPGAQKYIELGDDEKHVKKDIDLATYIKVGQVAKVPSDELKISNRELFVSYFDDIAFMNPQAWYRKTWKNGVKASAVFGQCDGVILVTQDAYKVIPRAQLNSELIFSRLSQARTHFSVK